ncbi:hypothetical protein HDE_10603 [Halotydeus destructor]|nr:hypothetical protein HDE_10603 [Halotydeus destructor]
MSSSLTTVICKLLTSLVVITFAISGVSGDVPWSECATPTKGKFCMGARSGITSYPAGQGCLASKDCDLLVLIDAGPEATPEKPKYHHDYQIFVLTSTVLSPGKTEANVINFFLTKSPVSLPADNGSRIDWPDKTVVMQFKDKEFENEPKSSSCAFFESHGERPTECIVINTEVDATYRSIAGRNPFMDTDSKLQFRSFRFTSTSKVFYPVDEASRQYFVNPRRQKLVVNMVHREVSLTDPAPRKVLSSFRRNFAFTPEAVDMFGFLENGELPLDDDGSVTVAFDASGATIVVKKSKIPVSAIVAAILLSTFIIIGVFVWFKMKKSSGRRTPNSRSPRFNVTPLASNSPNKSDLLIDGIPHGDVDSDARSTFSTPV